MDFRTVAAAQPYRGIRNNNPGNLKDEGIDWVGRVGGDPVFVIFSDMTYGLRALAMDLANKITRDGLTTITAIVSTYAPPTENNTAAYISAVAGDTGLDPNATIPQTQSMLGLLMRSVINHEEGDGPSSQFILDPDIVAGMQAMPTPLLNLFLTGPTIIDDNPTAFGFILLGLTLGVSYFVK